jgi:hypothetical protein
MELAEIETIKRREIFFVELHPDPNQAETAALLLDGVEGIIEVAAGNAIQLEVQYDVLQVTLEQIETALTETGFHISNRLIHKLKRALYYYTEETLRANCGCTGKDCNSTRKIFINRYQQRNHDCRDNRPEHWRKYL